MSTPTSLNESTPESSGTQEQVQGGAPPAGVPREIKFTEPESTFEYNLDPPLPVLTTDENGRRVEARQTRSFAVPPGKSAPPLKTDAHGRIVFQVAHRNQRPRCSKPAIRFLAAFPVRDPEDDAKQRPDELKEWFEEHHKTGECKESTWWIASHSLGVVCTSTERQQSKQVKDSHIDKLSTLHVQRTKDRESEWRRNVEQMKVGETGLSTYAKSREVPAAGPNPNAAARDETFERTVADLKKVSTQLPASSTLADQNWPW